MEDFFAAWKTKTPCSSSDIFLLDVLVTQRVNGDPCAPTAFLFGRTRSGHSISVRVSGWLPWVRFVGTDTSDPYRAVQRRAPTWCTRNVATHNGVERVTREHVSKLFGWVAADDLTTRVFPADKVYVTSLYAVDAIAKLSFPGVLVTDTLQKPRTRFLNDTGLIPCGWFRVPHSHAVDRITISDIELHCDVGDISNIDDQSVPQLVLASFDCEMSSYDGTLPSPHKGDAVFCISTSFSVFGTRGIKTVTVLLGENSATSTDTSLLLYAPSQDKVVETWRQLIQYVDPDILTGWNIDGFDFAFVCDAYNSSFVDPCSRGTEGMQAALAQFTGASRMPLHDAISMLTHAQRASVYASREWNSPHVRTLLRISDGSVTLHDDDESDDTPTHSSLPPKQLNALREEIFKYISASPPAHMPPLPTAFASLGADAQTYMTQPRRTDKPVGMYLSRFRDECCVVTERTLSTAARGDNVMLKLPQTGRVVVDMMRIIKDDQKPSSNALRYAANTWLDDISKLDMPIADLFAAWRARDYEQLRAVATYCERDAEIPLQLMLKLQYVTSWIGLCRVCGLGMDTVVNGGQQQRVFAIITRRVLKTHAVMTEASGWPSTNEYVGATVIDPKAAFYDTPLSTLDFASLYPSIEASNNLCFSTLVTDRSQLAKLVRNGKPLYQDFSIDHPTPGGVVTHKYAFVTHVPSVLADLLVTLMSSRKRVKREMEATTDAFAREVLNKRQLALKVVCNSVYGFCGVDPGKGLLSCKPVAAATTLIGRRLIGLTKGYVESNFPGSDVVYGDTDSVMIHWNVPTLEEAFVLGERAAKDVTTYLRTLLENEQGGGSDTCGRDIKAMVNIIKLEHEKEYWPYLLCKKKNYAGRKWTPTSFNPLVFKDEIDIKGLQAVRRDTAPLVVDLSMRIIDELLLRKSASVALDMVRDTLRDVARGILPLESYVMSKSIAASYVSENIPHVAAWKRMCARGEDAPPIGGRMPFVITSGAGSLASRAEHPSAATIKTIDTLYYLKALENPLRKLLQFADSNLDDLFCDASNAAVSRHSRCLVEGCYDGEVAPSPPRKKKRTGGTRGLCE